ncbi:MAG TPA: methyltransferase domain-containing protein [Gammaproteobacteria bacterium]|nr:methyltransferase domain-containing protein [Gammaproteobacteria bacterium]
MFTGKCDLWFDLRNKLPFRNSTITAIYSHHVIEHLPDPGAHFRDVFRCLKSGGVYRVGGPNGDAAIRKFIDNDTSWFSNFPDERNSIGGKLDNFIFCRQEHLSLLTLSYLHEIMSKAGFTDIRQCLPVKETGYPDIFNPCIALESETDFDHPHTLMIEARKP